ncbi:MAG: twin-arginine translocase TatA/TatE family subunit [Anaerolineae bacterium]|nr:twin-arginine translocase TatA/TatE family subunit [Anaerolineae bacterium]
MMASLGGPELLLVLAIVILLFGVGRVSRIGGELGSAVANFRKGLQEGAKGKTEETEEPENAKSV